MEKAAFPHQHEATVKKSAWTCPSSLPSSPPGLAQPLQVLRGVAQWPAGPERVAREGLLALARAQLRAMQPWHKFCLQSSVTRAQEKSRQMQQVASSRSSSAATVAGHSRDAGQRLLGVFRFWEQSKHGCWDETLVAVGPPGSCRPPRWLWDTSSCRTSGGTARGRQTPNSPSILPLFKLKGDLVFRSG